MIAYSDQGNGSPLLFIHGFCENKELWTDFERVLNHTNRVITVDLPGFGESERLIEDNTKIEDLASSVLELLENLNIPEIVIIGHSLGGYVALAMIEKKPAICKGLCMFHSTAFADTEEKKQNRDKTLDFIRRQGVTSFIIAFVPSLFFPNNRARLSSEIENLQNIAMRTSEYTVNVITMAMRNRKDRTHVLKSISAPVLYLIGKEDLAVPFELSEKQMNIAKNSQNLVLENTGHMGMYEQQETTLNAIQRFAKNAYEKINL